MLKQLRAGLNSLNIINTKSCNFRCTQVRLTHNNNSKIRQLISDLNEYKEPLDHYRFLILLSDNYYKKKMGVFPSNKYYIKKSKFPGKLTIKKYSDFIIVNNDINFESNPIPNQIYIKLQKENVYVLYHEYEQKILESKFNEFYDILTTIGANHIKISKVINNTRNIDVSADIGLNCANTTIAKKVHFQNENESLLTVKQEMFFNNDKDPNINSIYNNNYFYLPYQMDLQQLIIRRIENNLISDIYVYNHYHHNLLNKSIMVSLNKLNIGINYKFKSILNFQIEYEIHFNNIKNEKLNFIHVSDELNWFHKIFNKCFNSLSS